MEDKRNKLKLVGIGELAQFLTKQEKGMKKTFRWGNFPKAGMCRWQSSYEHTVDITWLAILVIDYLSEFYPKLDKYLLLKGAWLHDFGEVIIDADSPGDVIFSKKQENNNHRQGELDVFCRLFDCFSDQQRVIAHLVPYYLMQYVMEPGEAERLLEAVGLSKWKNLLFKHKEFEAKLFDAIEKLGYLVFVYQEYLKDPEAVLPLLILILKSHPQTLIDHCKEIKHLSHFYSEKDHRAVMKFLDDNQDVPDAFELANKIILENDRLISEAAGFRQQG